MFVPSIIICWESVVIVFVVVDVKSIVTYVWTSWSLTVGIIIGFVTVVVMIDSDNTCWSVGR